MKDASAGNNQERGNSALEIIIALGILTMVMAALIQITFGNQTVSADSQVNNEALSRAKQVIEEARASASQDFTSIASGSWTDDIYTETLAVIPGINPCQKKVSSQVSWATDPRRPETITLDTDMNDIHGTLFGSDWGADCGPAPSGDWTKPWAFAQLKQTDLEQVPTGIDVKNGIAYIAAAGGAASKNDFYIADVSGAAPAILSSLNTSTGLNAVDVAGNYAYVANQDTSAQVQIIRISTPSSPTIAATISVKNPVGSGTSQGLSVYYYNSRLYIGTSYTISTNNHEFQIYDVSSPTSPAFIGNVDVGYNVNAIQVSGTKAYLAVGSSATDIKDFFIFDLTNLAATPQKFSLSSVGCKSVYLAGGKLYVGCFAKTGQKDFFVLDANNPSTVLQSATIGFDVNTIRVAGKYAFLATGDKNLEFQAWDISASPMKLVGPLKIPKSAKGSAGLDYENNTIYIVDGSNGSAPMTIVKPQ